jgi:hypothetical protein
MLRLWSARGAAAVIILVGVIGIQGAAHASPFTRTYCDFTATSAGNGMQILSYNLTPVGTLKTGEVDGLYNTIITYNNVVYWNALPANGNWYPIRTANNSTIYMTKDNSSCTTF